MKILSFILLILLITGCGNVLDETQDKKVPSSLTFDELEFTSPEQAYWFISEQVEPKRDECDADQYKSPRQTYNDRAGDCEDFALLYGYFLENMGYTVEFINLNAPGYCHAICVFKVGNRYRYTSNEYLIVKSFATIEEMLTYECRTWTHYTLYTFANVQYNEPYLKKI